MKREKTSQSWTFLSCHMFSGLDGLGPSFPLCFPPLMTPDLSFVGAWLLSRIGQAST